MNLGFLLRHAIQRAGRVSCHLALIISALSLLRSAPVVMDFSLRVYSLLGHNSRSSGIAEFFIRVEFHQSGI
jgi:hypothetical protein